MEITIAIRSIKDNPIDNNPDDMYIGIHEDRFVSIGIGGKCAVIDKNELLWLVKIL